MSFTLGSTVKSYPRLPYENIKNDILGKNYDLSLVFVGEARSARLNQEHRDKNYTPNVLSFPLSKTDGEIYITPSVAKREAKDYGHTYSTHIAFLFIHGLLHLKGLDHGPKMESLEEKFLKKFKS